MAAALAGAAAVGAAVDPFGLVHVSSQIALPSIAFAGACALGVRRKAGARWVVLAFLAGYLLKGAGIFHPSYFYPDVRNHRRYVFALAEAEGSLLERGVQAQIRVKTAYPRTIAGRVYAMPYSPLYFVPFGWLGAVTSRLVGVGRESTCSLTTQRDPRPIPRERTPHVAVLRP